MDNLIILDSERRYFPSSNKLLAWLYQFLEDKYLKITYEFLIIPKIKKYIKKKDTKVIAADKETEIILKKYSIPFSDIYEYMEGFDYKNSEKEVIEFIRKIPNTIPEIDINYKGNFLWKFDEEIILGFFSPQLINNIEFLHKAISKEKAKQIIILDSSSRLGIIQKKFNNIIKIQDKTNILSKFKKTIFDIFMPFAIKTIDKKFMKIIEEANYAPKKTNKIIFFDRERAFKYSYPFLNKIKEKVSILQDEEYKKEYSGFDFDKLKNYIDQNSKKDLFYFKKDLKKKLKNLKNSNVLKNSLMYKDFPLFDSLKDMFEYLFTLGYLKSAFYYESLNNFFIKQKPKLIILMGEGPKSHKIISVVSRKYDIKLLYMMHGVIGENNFYSNLISDRILVYGEYYKKIFTDLGNNKKKIFVTGNPSWDNLTKIKFDKNKLYSKLRLPNKKIVLLATTHIPQDVRNRLAYTTIKAMKKLPNYQLVIKLHPEEKPDFYKKLLKKFKLQAKIVEDISLLHSLIKYSELIIISDSTVGLEALILNKPLIDMYVPGVPHWNDYTTKKVALRIERGKELLPAIKSILENKNTRNGLRKNREKYVYEHAYKQDGNATERVIKIIKDLIKNK